MLIEQGRRGTIKLEMFHSCCILHQHKHIFPLMFLSVVSLLLKPGIWYSSVDYNSLYSVTISAH